jgi:hypothetical protein
MSDDLFAEGRKTDGHVDTRASKSAGHRINQFTGHAKVTKLDDTLTG